MARKSLQIMCLAASVGIGACAPESGKSAGQKPDSSQGRNGDQGVSFVTLSDAGKALSREEMMVRWQGHVIRVDRPVGGRVCAKLDFEGESCRVLRVKENGTQEEEQGTCLIGMSPNRTYLWFECLNPSGDPCGWRPVVTGIHTDSPILGSEELLHGLDGETVFKRQSPSSELEVVCQDEKPET